MSRLKNKIAVVTGGTRGMGAAISRLFVDEGATVIVASRAETPGREFAMRLGATASFHAIDVAQEEHWVSMRAQILKRWGRIDVLVNCAGVTAFSAVDDITERQVDETLGVNFKSVVFGLKHVGHEMKMAGKGAIVNIASMDCLRGVNGIGAYTASKAAMRCLSKAAAMELGPYGVRVNVIHPGAVVTDINPMNEPSHPQYKNFYKAVPLQRPGQPGEVAAATLFLASDEASYITGSDLTVDGGATAGGYYAMTPGAPDSIRV